MAAALVDEAQLAAWGRDFGRGLKPGHVVALMGELGAGKTTLVRAVAEGLGIAGSVTSPTFALVHQYRGQGVTVYHVDAYRLRPGDDARDLGFEEMLADPTGIVMVEWPERLGPAMPRADHTIRLAYADRDGYRRLEQG